MYFKYSFNKFKIHMLNVLNYLLLFLLLIIRPFKKIKIFELETRAIGHYSLSIEIFLNEIKQGIHDKNEIYLAIPNKKIVNQFLFKKWQTFFLIIPSKFYFFLNFLRKFKYGHLFLAPYRDPQNTSRPWQYIDIHNVLKSSTPMINFSNEEIKKGNEMLKDFGIIDDNYICFINRGSEYRGDIDSCLNTTVNNQIKGIKELTKYGLKAIRMGVDGQQALEQHPNIIDYANSKYKSDFNDIFLTFNCKFMISSGTGIDRIPILNRKKTLLINYFSDGMHDIHSEYSPILIPKKIKCLKTGLLLTYKDIFELGLFKILTKSKLKEAGYLLIDITEDEACSAIMEMYNFVVNNKKIDFSKKINELFWSNYKKYNQQRPVPGDIIISPSFISKNPELF